MKRISLILFISIFLCAPNLYAQDYTIVDSLKREITKYVSYKKEKGNPLPSLADSTEVNIMYQLMLQYWTNRTDTALYYTQQLWALSEEIGYHKGIGGAYNAMGLINMQLKNYPVALDYYQKALRYRTLIGDKTGEGWTYNNMGLMYGNQGKYDESIFYHTQALIIRKEIHDFNGQAASYGKIGHCYDNLGKFPEAVTYYLKALKAGEQDGDESQHARFYGDIGTIYYNEGDYADALNNYRQELAEAERSNYIEMKGNAQGNIGRVLYKLGDDSDAINYLQASLKTNATVHDYILVADVYYTLGQVYLALQNYPLALSNADSAVKHSQITGFPDYVARSYVEVGSVYEKMGHLQIALDTTLKALELATNVKARIEIRDAYAALADISAEMGNYKDAYQYYRQYDAKDDTINNRKGMKKIVSLEMNYAFDKKEDSIHNAEERGNIIKAAAIRRKSTITNSLIIISILTLLAAFLQVRNLRLKRRRDKLMFAYEKNLMEAELANAQSALNEYTQSMAEKNKLLEGFRSEVEEFKSIYDTRRTENVAYLNKATILTQEDWNKFKELFNQVHKDFLKRLGEKLPELTPAETRLICLTKLSVGTKQMASILGVSDDTIKKSRHRLRKKLGLCEEDTIDDIVNSI